MRYGKEKRSTFHKQCLALCKQEQSHAQEEHSRHSQIKGIGADGVKYKAAAQVAQDSGHGRDSGKEGLGAGFQIGRGQFVDIV